MSINALYATTHIASIISYPITPTKAHIPIAHHFLIAFPFDSWLNALEKYPDIH